MSIDKHLYSCSSYYQVLITLMKACVYKQQIDIVLETHGVETANNLAIDIKKYMSQYVNQVFVCPDSEKVDPYVNRDASFVIWQRRAVVNHMKKILGDMDLQTEYSKIFVYWDLGYVGTYLNIKKIHYTLIEDSLNSYQHIKENRLNYRYIFDNPIKFKIKDIFKIGVIPFGYSKYCDVIEVNDNKNIQIPLDKVIVSPRNSLFNNLNKEDKNAIFNTFFERVEKGFSSKQNCVGNETQAKNDILILTEPFALTKRLPDEKTQIRLYKDIINQYGGGKIYIKPHPRDNLPYNQIFEDIILLEKNIPMEVLNFSNEFHVATSITVTSSAINGITCDEYKVYLGPEFLEKYKQ